MIVVIYAPPYSPNSGGSVALYHLAFLLREAGWESRICLMPPHENEAVPNEYCSDYVRGLVSPDEAVVVYPELTSGNPLGATRIIRWILAAPGVAGASQIHTWSPDDIVLRWDTPVLSSCLNVFGISPSILARFDRILEKKRGVDRGSSLFRCCHMVRKGLSIHGGVVPAGFHPPGAVNVDAHMCDFETGLNIMEDMDVLFTYDPYCAWIIYAVMCGCVVAVCPIPGVSWEEYTEKTMMRGGPSAGIIYQDSPIHHLQKTRTELLSDLAGVQQAWVRHIDHLRSSSIDRFMRIVREWDTDHALRNAPAGLLLP